MWRECFGAVSEFLPLGVVVEVETDVVESSDNRRPISGGDDTSKLSSSVHEALRLVFRLEGWDVEGVSGSLSSRASYLYLSSMFFSSSSFPIDAASESSATESVCNYCLLSRGVVPRCLRWMMNSALRSMRESSSLERPCIQLASTWETSGLPDKSVSSESEASRSRSNERYGGGMSAGTALGESGESRVIALDLRETLPGGRGRDIRGVAAGRLEAIIFQRLIFVQCSCRGE
jgi:hypothetical protein